MFETSTVEHLSFEDTIDYTEYRGRHTGYERLPQPVTHERTFHLTKGIATLTVTDRLRGSGTHTVTWHFHLAPGIAAEATGDGQIALVTPRGRWTLSADPTLTAAVSDAWYSPSYGVRIPCRVVEFERRVDVSAGLDLQFRIAAAVDA
jgi:uncharacterized heparinase superfamily protein